VVTPEPAAVDVEILWTEGLYVNENFGQDTFNLLCCSWWGDWVIKFHPLKGLEWSLPLHCSLVLSL